MVNPIAGPASGAGEETEALPPMAGTPGAPGRPDAVGGMDKGATPKAGTAEIQEEKRIRWREIKRKQREKVRGTAPLPGLEPTTDDSHTPHPNDDHTENSHQNVRDFLADLPLVEWTSEELAEITQELILVLQQSDRESLRKKCLAANLPPDLTRDILGEAEMPLFCSKIFEKTLPRIAAKYLNMAKFDLAYKDEGMVVVALAYYLWSRMSRDKRLKKVVQAAIAP